MKANRGLPEWARDIPAKVLDETSQFVIGKREIVVNLLVALLAGGHVLLEGVPGVAKTHIAKTFASTIGCEYSEDAERNQEQSKIAASVR